MLSLLEYLRNIYHYTCEQALSVTSAAQQDVCGEVKQSSLHALSHLLNARKRYCNWKEWVREQVIAVSYSDGVS